MSRMDGYNAGMVGNAPKEPESPEYMRAWKEGDTFYQRDVWDAYSDDAHKIVPDKSTKVEHPPIPLLGKFFGGITVWLICSFFLFLFTDGDGWLYHFVLFGGLAVIIAATIILVVNHCRHRKIDKK